MIKLFASDLDGTILYGFGPDEYCLETIQKIIDDKKYFVISTGRPLFKNQAKGIGFMDYDVLYIAMNGSVIRDSKFDVIYEEPLTKESLKEILDKFPDSHMEYISSSKVHVHCDEEEYIRYRRSDEKDPFATDDKLFAYMENIQFNSSAEDILKENIIKINGRFIHEEEQFEEVKKYCRENTDKVTNTPFKPDFVEITSAKASKGNAVKQLAKMLGIKEEECAVFGDAENDISMLSAFENAYVPENGSEAAKKFAREITPPCTEHGILNKMRELLK